MTKILAFHLPQFHSFPENDEWWGNGFTDWVNVKNAKPLFSGHNQPRIPYKKKYYNLLDYNTRKWQAETAAEYGIYGFCYYHYWFNGKLLMEKPLEALLMEPEIDFPFCLCWANEPWTRAWDGKTSTVLMPQKYGSETEWKKHIQYLMPFFKDLRYIKIKNRPLFVIYRSNNIPRCNDMIDYWNTECVKSGFDGIHLVEEMNAFQDGACCTNSSAVLAFEPSNIQRKRRVIERIRDRFVGMWLLRKFNHGCKIFDYSSIWNKILDQDYAQNKPVYPGGVVDWDNSPRKKMKGIIYRGASPEIFEQFLKKLLEKAEKMNAEFVFLNAWNEWAEGAYLEPDVDNKFEYLNAVREAISKR